MQKAFEHLNIPVAVKGDLAGASKLIIPGVGAFGAAMERLGPLATEIHAFVSGGGPVLGICLGQQLLFETSEELGEHRGLGLLPGRVRYLPKDAGLKVPHVGWSPLSIVKRDVVLDGVVEGDQAYFVHSLYTDCSDASDVVATAEHAVVFPAAVRRGNVWGLQFHPEKSSAVGLSMLERFARC